MADNPFLQLLLEGGMEETASRGGLRTPATGRAPAASAAPSAPLGAAPGGADLMGFISGRNNTLFGPSEAQRADMLARERTNAASSAASAQQREQAEAMQSLLTTAGDLATRNPELPANVLFKQMLADPNVRKNLLRLPAGSHVEALNAITGALVTPQEKPVVVPGDAVLATPQGKPLLANPKPDKAASEFSKELSKKLAGNIDKLQEDGQAARYDSLVLDQLGGLLDKKGFSTGAGAAITAHLARLGIKVPGASDVEAFDSLVSRLIPTLGRQGLPGAASDKDVAMFRASLPELMKTKQGNQVILDTLRAMNDSRIRASDVATTIMEGDMTQREAVKALKGIPDPLVTFREWQRSRGGRGSESETVGTPKVRTFNPATGRLE